MRNLIPSLLYATIFTLPMYNQLNNYLLGSFIVVGGFEVLFSASHRRELRKIWLAWPILSLFGLALLACLRTWEYESFQNLERFWSLALVPVVIMANRELFFDKKRAVFLALAYGTLTTLLICYGNVLFQIFENGEALANLYNENYIGFQFTEIADSHPAYLGLFILVSIVFLLGDKQLPKMERAPHIFLLVMGLFHLAGRTALLLILVFFFILLVRYVRRYRWQVLTLFVGIALVSVLFIRYGSPQMNKLLFDLKVDSDVNRITRWEVAYTIFKDHPIFGAGYTEVRQLRAQLYEEKGLFLQLNGDYNTHNQFLEYLSTNGAIGGFVFAISMAYLMMASLYYRDLVYLFLFGAFIICTMTESMLVRIKGIEFLAIFGTLFIAELAQKTDYNKRLSW